MSPPPLRCGSGPGTGTESHALRTTAFVVLPDAVTGQPAALQQLAWSRRLGEGGAQKRATGHGVGHGPRVYTAQHARPTHGRVRTRRVRASSSAHVARAATSGATA